MEETAAEIASDILSELQEWNGFQNWWDSLTEEGQDLLKQDIQTIIYRKLQE